MARLRTIAIPDGIATLSAYANDDGYESVFAEPVRALGQEGDVAIAISASGNSPNVLYAIHAARELGMKTIGLAGNAGGRLKELVDVSVVVPSDSTERIEDIHLIVNHLFTVALRDSP